MKTVLHITAICAIIGFAAVYEVSVNGSTSEALGFIADVSLFGTVIGVLLYVSAGIARFIEKTKH